MHSKSVKAKLLVIVAPIALMSANCFAQATAATTAPPVDPAVMAKLISQVKTIIPQGSEIAGAYTEGYDDKTKQLTITLRTGNDYQTTVASNFAFGDLNGDGKQDLVVVTEDAPSTAKDGSQTLGERKTLVYLSDASGALQLFDQNSGLALGEEDGGVFGDPLSGVKISNRGILLLDNYGGSSDRWGDTEKFQIRNGSLVMIGQTKSGYSDLNMIGAIDDVDLLTGNEIITQMRGSGKKPLIIRHQLPVKPLVKFSDAKSANAG